MTLPSSRHRRQSLTERLRIAEDEDEIRQLLGEGDGYEDATEQTRRRWKRQANKRRKEISKCS